MCMLSGPFVLVLSFPYTDLHLYNCGGHTVGREDNISARNSFEVVEATWLMLFYNLSVYVKQSVPRWERTSSNTERRVSYCSTFTAHYFMPELPYGTVMRWKVCHACLSKTSGTAVDVLPFLAHLTTVHPEVAFQECQECGLNEMNGIQVNFHIKTILEKDYFLLLSSWTYHGSYLGPHRSMIALQTT